MNKAVSAGKNYNTSLNKLHILQNNFSSDVNQVHKNYINNVILEIELKIKAVDKLKDAIGSFEVNYNSTGSGYAVEANDFMNESMKYKNVRDSLVSDNPKLFKQNFII